MDGFIKLFHKQNISSLKVMIFSIQPPYGFKTYAVVFINSIQSPNIILLLSPIQLCLQFSSEINLSSKPYVYSYTFLQGNHQHTTQPFSDKNEIHIVAAGAFDRF